MKKKLLPCVSALCLSLSTVGASADTTLFAGINILFGDVRSPSYGVTVKVLSNNTPEEVVASLGASYYFGKVDPIGLDIGAAYSTSDVAVALGYDLLQGGLVAAIGTAKTAKKAKASAAPEEAG